MTAVATWIATVISNGVDATTFNLGNVTVPSGGGTVAVLVSLTTSNRVSISSATLGGVSMTLLDTQGAGGFETLGSFKLDGVAAGAQNLTIVMSGTIGGSGPPNVAAAVWRIAGNAGTPFAHGSSNGSTSLALNTAAGGCAIYAVQGSGSNVAFSSATTRSGPTSGFVWDMAGDLATSAATPHTETVSGSAFNFIGVAWQAGGTVANVFALGVGAFALAGQAVSFSRQSHLLLGTGSFLVRGTIMGFLHRQTVFKHNPVSTTRLLPVLEQSRVNGPVLDEARET